MLKIKPGKIVVLQKNVNSQHKSSQNRANIFIYHFLNGNPDQTAKIIEFYFILFIFRKTDTNLFVGYICDTDLPAYKNIKKFSCMASPG